MVQSKEQRREYLEKNKEKIAQKNKEYRVKNKDRLAQKKREYNKKNKDKISKYNKEYNQKNKERIREKDKENNKNSPEGIKIRKLIDWKRYGVIGDLSTLYDERYLPSTTCEVCNKIYSSTYDRCMLHDYKTGEFMLILCRSCNNEYRWKKIADREKNLNIKEYFLSIPIL